MTTCQGTHELDAIYRHGSEMEETVVRWCVRCGAIVVDVDVDGRTAPGQGTPMRLPALDLESLIPQPEQP